MKRLAVARLWHEGNSFCPDATTLDDFRQREWVAGEDALDHYRGTATEMGAVVDFLDGTPRAVGPHLERRTLPISCAACAALALSTAIATAATNRAAAVSISDG